MIYATMCVGSKWTTKYQHIINAFSSKNHLEVLTDNIDIFDNSYNTLYDRDIFSYYEKINFIFNLSKTDSFGLALSFFLYISNGLRSFNIDGIVLDAKFI